VRSRRGSGALDLRLCVTSVDKRLAGRCPSQPSLLPELVLFSTGGYSSCAVTGTSFGESGKANLPRPPLDAHAGPPLYVTCQVVNEC
jgi:hypothetical protein